MATELQSRLSITTAVPLTYGWIQPKTSTALPELERYLVPGLEFERGVERETAGIAPSFVLGDVAVDLGRRILAGRIGYLRHAAETVYDEYRESFESGDSASATAFAIHLDEGWMVFEDAAPGLPARSFVAVIADMINIGLERDYPRVEGDLVEREGDSAQDFVAKLDRLTQASFALRPSNPRDADEWARLDELLKQANAAEGAISFANPAGLAAPTSDDTGKTNPLLAALAMTDDGYGGSDGFALTGDYLTAKAVYDGRTRRASLRDEIGVTELEEAREEDDSQDGVIRALIRRLEAAVEIGLLSRWLSTAR
jgi:hypothetical protein